MHYHRSCCYSETDMSLAWLSSLKYKVVVWSIKKKKKVRVLSFWKSSQSDRYTNEKNGLTLSNAGLFAISQHISPSQCQTKLTMSAGIFYYVNEPDTTWKLTLVWALALLIGISSQLLELLCQKFFCAVLFTYYIYSFFTDIWVHRSMFKTFRTHLNTLLSFSYAEFSSYNMVWGLTDEQSPRVLFFLACRKKSHFKFTGHSVETDFPYWLIYSVDVTPP